MKARQIAVLFGNRERDVNELMMEVIRQNFSDVECSFIATDRVALFIDFATQGKAGLAIFAPPGNLIPDQGNSHPDPVGEAERIVRVVKSKRNIPVLAMCMDSHAQERLLAAGADAFVPLAFTIPELKAAVDKCLGVLNGKYKNSSAAGE